MENRNDSNNLLFLNNINRVYDHVMSKRANKQETELRVAHAAELVAEGQAYSSITTHVAA